MKKNYNLPERCDLGKLSVRKKWSITLRTQNEDGNIIHIRCEWQLWHGSRSALGCLLYDNRQDGVLKHVMEVMIFTRRSCGKGVAQGGKGLAFEVPFHFLKNSY